MDFTLTEEQQLLRDSARHLLAGICPPSLPRAHMGDPTVADPLWEHLGDWVALSDGPLVDRCLFFEEMGRALVPGPFFATTALFAPLARHLGRPVQGSGTVAMAGLAGHWQVADEPVRTFVLEADRVDEVAVVLPGPSVAFLAPDPAGLREVGTLDTTRRVFEVVVPSGPAVDAIAVDEAALGGLVETWTVSLAAEMMGVARWLLEASVAYAKERVQFDQPIGAFQAVQHTLADMALSLERATAAVYYAAMAIDADDPDRHRAAHVAKAAAGEAATRCARDGIQVHGGIGYTWEHDLHLYLRRAFASEYLLGTRSWHHDRLADLLLG